MLVRAGAGVFVGADVGEGAGHFHFLPALAEAEAEGFIGGEGGGDIVGVGRGIFRCAGFEKMYSWVKSYLCPKPREVVLQPATVEGML